MAAAVLKPYQLLEVNLISAQDLEPVAKKMKTYCKSWVHPNRKLISCVDTEGNNNPTWNDKFVFRVNEDFLREDNSAVMIEIYAPHWFRDSLVGTVRVLVGNLFPPTLANPVGMRFVALQVRRPSGRPQGILNIGVALLDGCLRSMPMYKGCASAVGYRDLMLDLPPNLQWPQQDDDDDNTTNRASNVRPIMLRSRSERSIGFDIYSANGSMVGAPTWKAGPKNSSILSITEPMDHFIITNVKGKGKASSVINGAELREKPREKGKKGKASSVISDSLYSKSSSFNAKEKRANLVKTEATNDDKNNKEGEKPDPKSPKEVAVDEKLGATTTKDDKLAVVAIGRPAPIQLGSSILSFSEIGPSPSEMAYLMAEKRYPLNNDNESSVLDGWSLDESIEGLKSKLQRWRTELPPLYDHHGYASTSDKSSAASHARSRSESSSGLFSCFGNICGYECQCIIGQPPSPRKGRGSGSRFSSSVGSPTRSSLL